MLFHIHRILPESQEKEIYIFPQRKNKPQSVTGDFQEKLEKISLMFSSCSHSHPGDPQPNTLTLRELVE